MTTKAELHGLIDRLPERQIETVARVLAELLATSEEESDPLLRMLAAAPIDDEPLSDEARAAHRAGWEEYQRGEGRILDLPPASVKRSRAR